MVDTVRTTVEAEYEDTAVPLGLRGSLAPLTWEATMTPTRREGSRTIFELDLPAGELLEFKVLRGDAWSRERNYSVSCGESCVVRPWFQRDEGRFEPKRSLRADALGRDVTFEVFLPPSYDEHPSRRYPVLYAQDGQVVYSTGGDDMGPGWGIDHTLNELYGLAAIEEIVVVAVTTSDGRIDMLSPSKDDRHGGGRAADYLAFLVDTLKPWIDRTYRTQPGVEDTALLGSSMGGLFSFYAAWSRSDVFGKAACLSSSFWWNDRWMIREVRAGGCPVPRPLLYIDSGAAKSRFEEDANRRDGYEHTMAMRAALVGHCYDPGKHLHTLAFAGQSHDTGSWGARVATPLQLLFPRER